MFYFPFSILIDDNLQIITRGHDEGLFSQCNFNLAKISLTQIFVCADIRKDFYLFNFLVGFEGIEILF